MSLDKDCCLETYAEAYRQDKKNEKERILKLIKDTYVDPSKEEWGSFIFSDDIVELIEGNTE